MTIQNLRCQLQDKGWVVQPWDGHAGKEEEAISSSKDGINSPADGGVAPMMTLRFSQTHVSLRPTFTWNCWATLHLLLQKQGISSSDKTLAQVTSPLCHEACCHQQERRLKGALLRELKRLHMIKYRSQSTPQS